MDAYRYFYDSLTSVGRMSTDDATYVCSKYLKNPDPRLLDRLMTRFAFGDGLRIDELNAPSARTRWPPLPSHVLEQYQDIWVKGRRVAPGVRECAPRYEMIKPVVASYRRPFSVLDIGANLGYFSIRIAEDFDATCVCVENVCVEWLRQVLAANEARSVYALDYRMDLDTLRRWGECEQFDVVLALSILHHIDAPAAEVVDALRQLGRKVVLELPTEERACGLERRDAARDLDIGGYEILGHGRSHLDGPARPIVLLDGAEPALRRGYLASSWPCAALSLTLTEDEAVIAKNGETRPFVPGLNAHNFFYLGGFHPPPRRIAEQLQAAPRPNDHGDLAWWNVVLSGGGIEVIDDEDNAAHGFDDAVQFGLMVAIASSLGEMPSYHGRPLSFVEGSEACRLLVAGWHAPDPAMTWSHGAVGLLALPGPRAEIGVTFQALVHMMPVAHEGERTVRFRVNGVEIATVAMGEGWSEEVVLSIPAETWNLSVPAIVEMTASASVVPAEVLDSPDIRRIGVGISRCEFRIE